MNKKEDIKKTKDDLDRTEHFAAAAMILGTEYKVRTEVAEKLCEDLTRWLTALEPHIRFDLNDAGEVECPCCKATCTRGEWYAEHEPVHKDDCAWKQAQLYLGTK